MLKDNFNHNSTVTSTTAFIQHLRNQLPEFFTTDTCDETGQVISKGNFDFAKFKQTLTENAIQTELTSGYQLNFIGKDYAKKQAGEAPTTIVLPDNTHNQQPENQNSQNLFFTGDNLEVLRHLQAGYENSIDVIYIDPPYNTGSDGFVYPDKFEYSDDKLQAMFGMSDEDLERLKSIQGRATHSAWLTFMYPRLWLAKRLLKETGVIFVSIDDNEQANLKLLMDEIFGEGNFVADFVWQKKTQPSFLSKEVANVHEYILCYRKSDLLKLKGGVTDPNKAVEMLNISNNESIRIFNKNSIKIENGKFTGELKSGIYGNAELAVELLDDVQVENGTPTTDIQIKGRFKWVQSKIEDAISNGATIEIKSIKTLRPTLYRNSDEVNIKPPISIFAKSFNGLPTNTDATTELKKLFDDVAIFTNPKPSALIKYLLDATTYDEKGATILDFFAGSATTADAVMQLNAEDGGNRKYILVQLPEPTYTQNSDGTKVARKGSEPAFNAGFQSIDEISRERIKRASQKIQEEKASELDEHFDGGFKHYRVLEPSQATLDDLDSFDIETGDFLDSKGNHLLVRDSTFDDMISPFSASAFDFDDSTTGEETILTTWLLADGYPILSPIEEINLAGYQAPYVNSERLYLIAEGWSSEQTKALVNTIGKNEQVVQTIVLYGYSFGLESMRELELALSQLDTKVNLIKRY